MNGSLMLFQLSALLPLLRGMASPCNYVVQREPRFEHVAGMEVAASFLDCTVGLALVYFGVGASSVLIGLVAAAVA
ncbi:oligosaccharide flippase family protein [Paraburkholderia sediminicola]